MKRSIIIWSPLRVNPYDLHSQPIDWKFDASCIRCGILERMSQKRIGKARARKKRNKP